MNKKSSAVQKATALIIDSIAAGVWKDGDRLPSIVQLSGKVDVSAGSMSAAVSALKKKGVLSGKRGGPTIVGQHRAQNNGDMSSRPPAGLWQKKRALLEQDILSGRFRSGILLSANELKAAYGVCYATLKKMLNALVADRLLVPYKKTLTRLITELSSSNRWI